MKKALGLGLALAAAACGTPPVVAASAPLPVVCGLDASYDGRACRRLSADRARLDRAAAELAAFRPEEARAALEEARRRGPYRHADHVRLYEQLGVALSYLELEREALEAFEMLLALSPGHAISYTLSPKATFLFERARARARRTAPELRITWPRDLDVATPVPIELEVSADPKKLLRRARVHARKKGALAYRHVDVELGGVGSYRRVVMPAVAPQALRPEVLELFVVAYDPQGSEVLLWGEATVPREVPVAYRPPSRWYGQWWVWGIAAGVIAAATGAVVFAATREPADRVDGTFSVR